MQQSAHDDGGLRSALSRHAPLIAFALFVLGAGGNPIAIRFSNAELPPFWGGAARLGAAAAISWLFVLARRTPLPRGRALLGVLLYGTLSLGALNALAFWTLVRVQPGLTSVFLAFVPLATVLMASVHGLEPLTRRKVAGALIAAAGIALVVGAGFGPSMPLPVLHRPHQHPLCPGRRLGHRQDFPSRRPHGHQRRGPLGRRRDAGRHVAAGRRDVAPSVVGPPPGQPSAT